MARTPAFPYGAGPLAGGPTLAAKPKPKPQPQPQYPPWYLTPQQQREQAVAAAQASAQPLLDYYTQRDKDAQASAQQQAEQTRARYQALAEILKGLAPQIQGIYKEAGDTQATYAKGLGTGQAAAQSEIANQINQILGAAGSPQGQMVSPEAGQQAGNALYTLGGFIPGQTFAREGAAFGSAAAFLPASTIGRGEYAAQADLAAGEKERGQYQDEIAKLLVQQPGRVQELLREIQGQQFDYQKWATDQAYRQAQLSKPQVFGSASGGYFEWDPTTGNTRQIIAGNKGPTKPMIVGSSTSGYYAVNPETLEVVPIIAGTPGAPKGRIVGSDKVGRYWYDPTTGTKTEITPPMRTQKPKVDPKSLGKARSFATATAAEAHRGFWTEQTTRAAFPGRVYGSEEEARKAVKPGGNVGYSVAVQDKDGNVIGYDNWNPPINYQVALQEMLKMPEIAALPPGSRLRVVQEALNKFYKRGERGRPQRSFQERQQAGGLPGGAEGTGPPSSAVAFAVKQIGQPYQWGGEDRSEGGFDCSGLIDWAYKQAGIDFPGRLTTYTAMKVGRAVDPSREQLQPGDLIITNDGNHMVMYIGNGEVVAASGSRDEQRGNKGGRVVRQPVDYHLQRAVAVRRVTDTMPSTAAPLPNAKAGPQNHPDYVYDPKRKVWYNVDTGETWKGR